MLRVCRIRITNRSLCSRGWTFQGRGNHPKAGEASDGVFPTNLPSRSPFFRRDELRGARGAHFRPGWSRAALCRPASGWFRVETESPAQDHAVAANRRNRRRTPPGKKRGRRGQNRAFSREARMRPPRKSSARGLRMESALSKGSGAFGKGATTSEAGDEGVSRVYGARSRTVSHKAATRAVILEESAGE